jgi:hypothetical protein
VNDANEVARAFTEQLEAVVLSRRYYVRCHLCKLIHIHGWPHPCSSIYKPHEDDRQ